MADAGRRGGAGRAVPRAGPPPGRDGRLGHARPDDVPGPHPPADGAHPRRSLFPREPLTYPAGPRQKLQQHYAFINYASALAADAVFFNSAFHRDAFFEELPRLLKHYPDYTGLHTLAPLRERSRVLPVGLDLRRYDAHRPAAPRDPSRPPLIVWNHRWEYDKNPAAFFSALYRLAEQDIPFEVALAENVRQTVEFEGRGGGSGRAWSSTAISSRRGHARLLRDADRGQQAHQDFFDQHGGSDSPWPLACRLNYPALVPPALHPRRSTGTSRLTDASGTPDAARAARLREHVAGFDWRALAPQYDAAFAAVSRAVRHHAGK